MWWLPGIQIPPPDTAVVPPTNADRSRTRTRAPASWARMAATRAAPPEPTTSTSVASGMRGTLSGRPAGCPWPLPVVSYPHGLLARHLVGLVGLAHHRATRPVDGSRRRPRGPAAQGRLGRGRGVVVRRRVQDHVVPRHPDRRAVRRGAGGAPHVRHLRAGAAGGLRPPPLRRGERARRRVGVGPLPESGPRPLQRARQRR